MNKYYEHFKTIGEHRRLVREGCFSIGLYFQGLTHDLSKYSPTEFLVGGKYYQGYRSPNNAEREDIGYSSAWLHHKGRNKHHFEYWTDVPQDRSAVLAGVKMPPRYLAEMVMDRIAANKAYKGDAYTRKDPIAYLHRGIDGRLMHPETYKELEKILQLLADKGERAMYRYVRKMLKNGY